MTLDEFLKISKKWFDTLGNIILSIISIGGGGWTFMQNQLKYWIYYIIFIFILILFNLIVKIRKGIANNTEILEEIKKTSITELNDQIYKDLNVFKNKQIKILNSLFTSGGGFNTAIVSMEKRIASYGKTIVEFNDIKQFYRDSKSDLNLIFKNMADAITAYDIDDFQIILCMFAEDISTEELQDLSDKNLRKLNYKKSFLDFEHRHLVSKNTIVLESEMAEQIKLNNRSCFVFSKDNIKTISCPLFYEVINIDDGNTEEYAAGFLEIKISDIIEIDDFNVKMLELIALEKSSQISYYLKNLHEHTKMLYGDFVVVDVGYDKFKKFNFLEIMSEYF
ncbi:hypothetical protein Q7V64_04160 [Streptococcus suis]|nr:hypothetical protein [Streptococcus suis]